MTFHRAYRCVTVLPARQFIVTRVRVDPDVDELVARGQVVEDIVMGQVVVEDVVVEEVVVQHHAIYSNTHFDMKLYIFILL